MTNNQTMTEEELLLEYLTVNSAYEPQAIPETERFTFISKITGIPQVWTLGENGEPAPFAEMPDRVLSVFHSPDGQRTVIGMDHHGNEKQQLYILDNNPNRTLEEAGEELDGPVRGSRELPEPMKLVHSPEHFHYCGGWSPDGTRLVYSSNRRHPGHFDVYTVNADTGETETIYESDANCIPLSWIDDGTVLVSLKETNIDSAVLAVDAKSKGTTRLGPLDTPARYHSPAIIPGAGRGYLLTDAGEDTQYIASFSVGKPEKMDKLLHWEDWDIEEIALSPDGRLLAFTLNEGGISRLGFYSPETGAHELADGLPGGVIGGLSWLTGARLLFTQKSPTQPGDIWEYRPMERTAVRHTRLGRSDAAGPLWAEPELHAFRSFDGLEVPYFFYDQSAEAGRPAVIWVHGGPEGQSKAEYNPVVQYLVHRGFAVAVPNIRGSLGYGRRYLKLDDADKRLDAVADLAELAGDLAASHGVDAAKIGIIGRSYGGFMVLSALTHYPEKWAAGVDVVGMSNLRTFLENTGEWRRYLREAEYGSLAEHSEFFDRTAPMNLTDRIEAPLLVFHGRNDTRVPVSEAEQLVADLESRGREVELVIFENEGHQTERIENHILMHTKTVEFFGKQLRGDQ
ncbi:prolyl oligopeptidase family serine peptidase [Edaphobacillus lindanitolerans]|uniref:Dipeptidyl aminopeptidase/acylaminoacyl peptidase n=1 Tax=Edaphobacillus lindanitolerans TaxID=550447 RepID=A0A1U7PNX9_9BACI|nr:prolyl oligopeptidase family serine peptidase [Edaphobacillus lindanitolerans]SIT74176.1 Dipeptidyl aminopeptidase/acylaminoacyl peptidase [Edaphobacillus lindanitolerans]